MKSKRGRKYQRDFNKRCVRGQHINLRNLVNINLLFFILVVHAHLEHFHIERSPPYLVQLEMALVYVMSSNGEYTFKSQGFVNKHECLHQSSGGWKTFHSTLRPWRVSWRLFESSTFPVVWNKHLSSTTSSAFQTLHWNTTFSWLPTKLESQTWNVQQVFSLSSVCTEEENIYDEVITKDPFVLDTLTFFFTNSSSNVRATRLITCSIFLYLFSSR